MLSFIRRYQRYIYVTITVLVIISFSFFGTYEAFLNSSPHQDPTLFYAVDGKPVSRSEVDRMTLFLSTDAEDKILYRGVWGPNFLNDGVIQQDFFKTGLAQVLIENYRKALAPEFARKKQREKQYQPYAHPTASFIRANQVWKTMAPEIYEQYNRLREQQEATSSDAIDARVRLFLAERQFPEPVLRHVLKYQEQQFAWVSSDPQLDQKKLSLFGYYTVDDWFGPSFIRLVSEFIINAAKIATERGYQVSKQEALADLIGQAQKNYSEVLKVSNQGVANAREYMQEQIRRMGMDRSQVVEIWRQILLFRRLFQDFGHSVFIDTLPFEQYHQYAKEYVGVDLYSLPLSLHIPDFRSLQKFELYLNAVVQKDPEAKTTLALPKTFLSAEEVEKSHPQLVYVPYTLTVAVVDQQQLANRIPLRETWEWETAESNWPMLVRQFPELKEKKVGTAEERVQALNGLDRKTQGKIDAFARREMVKQRPELVEDALSQVQPEKQQVSLRKQGGIFPLSGFEGRPDQREKLWDYLKRAPLISEESLSEEQQSIQNALNYFSPDQRHVYAIRVMERGPQKQVLTFAEADRDGTLDELVLETLTGHYEKVREQEPGLYRKGDGSWKEVREVRDILAAEYFQEVLRAIRRAVGKQEVMSEDESSAYRFYTHLQNAQEILKKNPEQEGKIYFSSDNPLPGVAQQWLLEKSEKQVDRSIPSVVAWEQAFALKQGGWSPLQFPRNGTAHFYQVKERGVGKPDVEIWERTLQAYRDMSADAQQTLMRNLCLLIREKGASSLEGPSVSPVETDQEE